ncbi:uncharacterized protein [Paramormyrops kingsleyae]|uniref:uncharacterized protein n=1 Tax=Paramormyrops kingsleyae TaxID=1676925 RepID=UPI003B973EF7
MKMKIKSLTIILILLKFLNSDEWLVVTGADEPVYAHAGEDVTLSCSVNSTFNVTELQVEWTKTEVGIIVLQYSKGNILERYSGRAEFYIEEIPKGNFSVKLRKVRTEDKGEFRCEAYSDSDPGGRTTARIAALGYSSWIWGILVLCFAVIPVVILTVALLARNYIKEISCCAFTREELLNIRKTTSVDLLLTFLVSPIEILDILVKSALTLSHAARRQRRGKHAGALVRLRRRGLRTPLPAIFLSNIRSLCNRLDELQLLVVRNRDFSASSVLCFTETWLCGLIPGSALQLTGFQLLCAGHDMELSGKSKGGGICFL